jgi:LacI family transcriptional regulator
MAAMSVRVTMEDVARQSGVSLATVSLVLRDKPGITDGTRRRVLAVAKGLGYQRRPAAEPAGAVRQIGVVIKARADELPQANPFYGPVLGGIEAACRRQQINMLFGTLPVDEDNRPLDLPRMLGEDELDGVLLLGAMVEGDVADLLERRATPTTLVDAYARRGAYDSVVTDNFSGAYAAVCHLIGRGHRHIALVGSLPDGYPSIEERRRGYIQALAENAVVERYFADTHAYGLETGEMVRELLRRHPQVTALFCINDNIASLAMRAAQGAGRRIPEDLSIVGFDNIELAEHLTPALTTMHVDKVSMGRVAVQLLLNRIEHPEASPITALIRPTLVARQSVRTLAHEE